VRNPAEGGAVYEAEVEFLGDDLNGANEDMEQEEEEEEDYDDES